MGLLGGISLYVLVGLMLDVCVELHMTKIRRPHGLAHVFVVAMLWLPMLVWYGFCGRRS